MLKIRRSAYLRSTLQRILVIPVVLVELPSQTLSHASIMTIRDLQDAFSMQVQMAHKTKTKPLLIQILIRIQHLRVKLRNLIKNGNQSRNSSRIWLCHSRTRRMVVLRVTMERVVVTHQAIWSNPSLQLEMLRAPQRMPKLSRFQWKHQLMTVPKVDHILSVSEQLSIALMLIVLVRSVPELVIWVKAVFSRTISWRRIRFWSNNRGVWMEPIIP